MATSKRCDHDYKVQAVKMADEIGQIKVVAELGISKNMIVDWFVHSTSVTSIWGSMHQPARNR